MSRRGAKTEPDLFTLPEAEDRACAFTKPAGTSPGRSGLFPSSVGGRRVGASSGSRGKRSRAPRPANAPFGARERSERRARATGPYISSPQTGESGGYCRKGQRHPSGLPGRTEAGDHRPSVRRTAVRRPTSPAGRGQVVAALTMVGVAIGMSISRLDRTAATLQAERARVYQRRLCTPAVPRSR